MSPLRSARTVVPVVVALLSASAVATAAPQGGVKVGAVVPDGSFIKLLNHDGRTSWREFRGSTVLVQTFGHRSNPCRTHAVPLALALHERFGKDGLVCILQESQDLPEKDLLPFVVQKFPQSRAMVTQERLFVTESQTDALPYFSLIGVDGTLLFCGSTTTHGRKIEDYVELEVAKIKKGWGKSPEIAKARALMHAKKAYTEAAAALKAAEASVKPEAKQDLEEAKAELAAKHASARKVVESLQADGRYLEAQQAALGYRKSVQGDPEREKAAAELVAYFDREKSAKELKAERALEKLTAGFRRAAPTQADADALTKFAEEHDGLDVARRAKRLASAAAYKAK